MPRAPFVTGAVACAAALTSSTAALAAAVTNADLQGKKICWSDGGTLAMVRMERTTREDSATELGVWRVVGLRWSRPTASTLVRSPRTMGPFIFRAVSTATT